MIKKRLVLFIALCAMLAVLCASPALASNYADGDYTVPFSMEGLGRHNVAWSTATVHVEGGELYVDFTIERVDPRNHAPQYDWVKTSLGTVEPILDDENFTASFYRVPVPELGSVDVTMLSSSMSSPVTLEYTIVIDGSSIPEAGGQENEPETTPEPTPEATAEPTPEATAEPTPEATAEPTPEPTPEPSAEATSEPSAAPSPTPAPEASAQTSSEATAEPASDSDKSNEDAPESASDADNSAQTTGSQTPEAAPVPSAAPDGSAQAAAQRSLSIGAVAAIVIIVLAAAAAAALLIRRKKK